MMLLQQVQGSLCLGLRTGISEENKSRAEGEAGNEKSFIDSLGNINNINKTFKLSG